MKDEKLLLPEYIDGETKMAQILHDDNNINEWQISRDNKMLTFTKC